MQINPNLFIIKQKIGSVSNEKKQLIMGLILLIVVILGGYWFLKSKNNVEKNTEIIVQLQQNQKEEISKTLKKLVFI